MNDTKRPALSRTWQTVTTYRECSVVVEVSRDTVTLSREEVGGKLSAQVNGEAVELGRAIRLLKNANSTTVTAEVLAALPVTIGAARAAKLHKLMTRVGVPSVHHYASAARATGREVWSLASLTELEARQTWAYLRRMFPAAQHAA
ncbi:glycosyl hydrolase family 65 protein [Deinococcus sp.]|uniref:glycosyl hydrolase family 65 protein n=1 Tax=Deinococcus sp. TaxID=47478 RepID=UPI0025DC9D70|nr:glycosyl hydrolase family 65 protein [Deinococcus sp.]